MLKIYGSDLSSPANKIRFAANAMNLKYEYIKVNLREGEHKKEWFIKINPVGKIPAIDDNGFCLFESNAIIKYLAEKNNSPLYSKDLQARAVIDQWMDFASLHVMMAMSKILFNTVFYKVLNIPIDERSLSDGRTWMAQYLTVVNQQLSKNNYIVGKDFTIADVSLLAALDPSEIGGVDLTPYQSVVIWRNNLKRKEFYQLVHKEYGEALKQSAAQ